MVAPVGSGRIVNVTPVYTLAQVKKALTKYYAEVILHKILENRDQTEESQHLRELFLPLFLISSPDAILEKWSELIRTHNLPPFQIG